MYYEAVKEFGTKRAAEILEKERKREVAEVEGR